MRRFFPFLFIILFVSCQEQEKDEVQLEEKKKVEKVEKPIPVMATTAIPIMTYSRYEEPFFEDSLKMELPVDKFKIPESDSSFTVDYQFSASYPQSRLKEHEKFNRLVQHKVETYFKDHLLTDENDFRCFYVNAQYGATDFEFDSTHIGILFMEQDYFDGAAHYNHGYHSFHFDLRANREIKLTDILHFKPGEAQKFCDAFNPDPTSERADVILEGGDFSDDRPFTTSYGELYMYFSDYEKGPSMTRIRIPYSKFIGYVNPVYKFLFEH